MNVTPRLHFLINHECSPLPPGPPRRRRLLPGSFTGQKLPVQGVDSEALDTLIEAFYTGECPLSLGSAVAVFDAAVKLEVR